MLEILRDQIWQFVGAAFGFAAIIVSIVLYWTQRRRKALSYDILCHMPLLSVTDTIKGQLEIYFNGKPVQDIRLVAVKIINSGNAAIISSDYERPVNLSFGEEAQILRAGIVQINPDNIQASVDIEATRIVLEPVLLNSGDSVTLALLVSRLSEISVDGRIIGVKGIRKLAVDRVFKPLVHTATGLFCGAFGLFLVSVVLQREFLFWWGFRVLMTSVVMILVVEFFIHPQSTFRQLLRSRKLTKR